MSITALAITSASGKGVKVDRATAQKEASAPPAVTPAEYAKSRAKDVENALSDANIQRALAGDENALFKVGRMTFDSKLPSKFRDYIDPKILARIEKLKTNKEFDREYHARLNQPGDNPTAVFWGEMWKGSVEAFKSLGVGIAKIPGQLYNAAKNLVTDPLGTLNKLYVGIKGAASDFGGAWQKKGALAAFGDGLKGLEKTFLGISTLAEESTTMQRMRQERDEAVKDLETEKQRYTRLKAANLLTGSDLRRYKEACDTARLAKLNYDQQFEKTSDVAGETTFKTAMMVLTVAKIPSMVANLQSKFAGFIAKCPKPVQAVVAGVGNAYAKVATPVKGFASAAGTKALGLVPTGVKSFVANTATVVGKPFKFVAGTTSGAYMSASSWFAATKFGGFAASAFSFLGDKFSSMASLKNFGAFGKRWFNWSKPQASVMGWVRNGSRTAQVTKGIVASPVLLATKTLKTTGGILNGASKIVEGTIRSPFITAGAIKAVPALASPLYGAAADEIRRPQVHRDATISQENLEKLQKAYPDNWEQIAQKHESMVDRLAILRDKGSISAEDFKCFQKHYDGALDMLTSKDQAGAETVYARETKYLDEDEAYVVK